MGVFAELKRRNVFRVAAAYAVVSWLRLQIVAVITPFVVLPSWFGGFVPRAWLEQFRERNAV